MASEKEEFITKKYIPTGAPIVENDRTLIYKVRCMEAPGRPVFFLFLFCFWFVFVCFCFVFYDCFDCVLFCSF